MLLAAFIPALFANAERNKNDRFNDVLSTSHYLDKGVIEGAEDRHCEGWRQFTTDQDAHYFGFWVNPSKLQTLCYAEGDWTLVSCADAEHYNAEILCACEFYDEGYEFITLDIETRTRYEHRQNREQFLIKEAAI